jgi:hypothetical protein
MPPSPGGLCLVAFAGICWHFLAFLGIYHPGFFDFYDEAALETPFATQGVR